MHRFATVLNSNRPPTEQEARGIRGLLQELNSQLGELNEESPRYERVPEPDEVEMQLRQLMVASLRGALSAMRSLPAEILGEIFIICRDESHNDPEHGTTDSDYAPMVLTHVCSRWRQVALRMPRLWNRVVLLTDTLFEGKQSFVQEILDRSGPVTLSVSLLASLEWTAMQLGGTGSESRWLDIVWGCSHRLEHISLEIHSDDTGPNVMPTQTVFPILASVKIGIEGNGEPDLNAILESFQSSPLLRSLTMSAQIAYNDDMLDATFPWSQLTYLDLGAPLTIVGARYVLARCGALQTAKLRAVIEPETDESTPPWDICTLYYLSELELSFSWGVGVAVILDTFTFPQLSSLHIASEEEQPTNTLLGLHARSRFPLTHLSLVQQDLPLSQFVSLLRALPTLKTLVMENCISITDPLFRALVHDAAASADGRVLTHPRLAAVEIHPVTHIEGDVVARAAEYLAARAGDSTSAFPMLRTVRLYSRHRAFRSLIPRFADDIEARLAAISAAGFLVDLPR
ncbi:hypothetical protein DFH06DRAFT_475903 [Mycena polygramma]|nr:hypothetical protein DFH06DRAFT_475903 [Mycena polygramma]